MWFRTTSSRGRGFTLAEVLVAAAITLVLALVLVTEFTQSATAVDMATSRVEMQQLGRRVVDKLTPYISSAVDRGDVPAVDMPNTSGVVSEYVIFNTTEDFLDPAYDRLRNISPRFFEGQDYPTFGYVVWFEDDATVDATDIDQNAESKVVMMARLLDGYDRNNPWPSLDATVDPFVLVRSTGRAGQADGAELVDVQFLRLLTNAIEIRVRTRAQFRESHGNRRNDVLSTVSVIQLPSYTAR